MLIISLEFYSKKKILIPNLAKYKIDLALNYMLTQNISENECEPNRVVKLKIEPPFQFTQLRLNRTV